MSNLIEVFWALDKNLAYARHYPAVNWNISYSEFVETVKEWYINNISIEWLDYRAKAMDALRQDDELKRMVKLIGPDALPDRQRLTLKVIELLKEGFLNQNAYNITDRYTSPEKQFQMLKLIMDFNRTALHLIERKVPLYKIIELPIISEILKMKSAIPNDKLELINEIDEKIDKEFAKIETQSLRE